MDAFQADATVVVISALELPDELWARVSELVRRHGGIIAGRGFHFVTAVFGLSPDESDHPRRAIAAAREVNRYFGELAASRPLIVRMTVATGELSASRTTDGYHVSGETVELASRLQQLCDANDVLLSETTYDRVGDSIGARPLDSDAGVIKGKAPSIQIYRLERWVDHGVFQNLLHGYYEIITPGRVPDPVARHTPASTRAVETPIPIVQAHAARIEERQRFWSDLPLLFRRPEWLGVNDDYETRVLLREAESRAHKRDLRALRSVLDGIRAKVEPVLRSMGSEANVKPPFMGRMRGGRDSAGEDPLLTRRNADAVRLLRLIDDITAFVAEQPDLATDSTASGVDADEVDCSVFAPRTLSRGDHILIQLYAHLAPKAGEAVRLAQEMDASAQRLGVRTLELLIAHGTPLSFSLSLPGLEVDDPVQSLVWRGRTQAVQFGVAAPPDCRPGTVIGTVTVALNSVPIGHVKFRLVVEAHARSQAREAEPVGDQTRRYTTAFISYASSDRDKVLARVQMLRPLGIKYFQDVLDLEPGARWEALLYRHIDECDLFLLFWSRAARESEWVQKEIQHALDRKGDDDLAPPEIYPVIIEGPPIVPPPAELKHLHFDDRVRYFVSESSA